MATILHIETSTDTCSVGIAINGKQLAVRTDDDSFKHSELLQKFINECMAEAKITYDGLDAVAVSVGPGSYTGLRIGASCAKGICFAAGIPIITVNTLEALAFGYLKIQKNINKDDLIIPMIDARRMEVYCSAYNADGSMVFETKAEVLDENSFSDYLKTHRVHFVGNGAFKTKGLYDMKKNIISSLQCNASHLFSIAFLKFQQNRFDNLAYFEPLYLKPYQAIKPRK